MREALRSLLLFINIKHYDIMRITRRIEIARNMTAATAALKDWRVRNKHNRTMRQIARDVAADRGYIIATVEYLKAKYGDLCHYEAPSGNADKKHVWGIRMNNVWHRIVFVAI